MYTSGYTLFFTAIKTVRFRVGRLPTPTGGSCFSCFYSICCYTNCQGVGEEKMGKGGCIFGEDVLRWRGYEKCCDWAALYWFALSERAGGWNPLACNAGLSPRSRRLKVFSRAGRVMPLFIMGVDAPESCAANAANCGWYRGRIAFRPGFVGRGVFLFPFCHQKSMQTF